ncbi:class I SAM-dependent methyltransferase [Hydrogenophaga laconesensis]|uniref:SAM-dependent methyltransferase n=1 Tax=Hydrogenophaga laconesensis TaxID=1805971 RepID=A0ABU1VEK8_9BURK|nr:methyltransferase domain-containing protein [Hydrogenophaga laconesensis]MDR7095892.1 SAM-dependent methyltransferase [Hydrogenophaga laconesensis]
MRCPVCEGQEGRPFQVVGERAYGRCERCEATFLFPDQRPSIKAERAEYALHQNTDDDDGYRSFLARLATPLLQRLRPRSDGLDFGCGPGPVLAGMLREAGHTVALYDPFFHPDGATLEATYDFITCTEVAEHFHDPATEFRRLDRLLRPGGWLALMTRFQTDDTRFAQWHYRRDPTHVVFYREATLRWLARHHGWRAEVPCPNVVLMYKP